MDLDTVDHLLTTTRSIRKRLDFTRPVEPAVIERCIEIALHSPSGGNNQGWHFMVVTDPEKRVAIADLYRKAHKNLRDIRGDQPPWRPGDLRVVQHTRMIGSADYLRENFHEVPAYIIACIELEMEELKGPLFQRKSESFYTASLYGSRQCRLSARKLSRSTGLYHRLHRARDGRAKRTLISAEERVLLHGISIWVYFARRMVNHAGATSPGPGIGLDDCSPGV